MKREKIILSNVDLDILLFVKKRKEINIRDIAEDSNKGYLSLRRHIFRLISLGAIKIKKEGNFKIITLSQLGDKLIEIFHNDSNNFI